MGTCTFEKLPGPWRKALTKALGVVIGDGYPAIREHLVNFFLRMWSESVYPARPDEEAQEELELDLCRFLDGWRNAMKWVQQSELTEYHSDIDADGNALPDEVVTDCYLVPKKKVEEFLGEEQEEECDCQDCADRRIV